MADKKSLSERDICTKYITPAITGAGWDLHSQIREEVSFTKGRIIVRGKLHTRGEQKRADYILYYKSNIPLAVIEAKENGHSVGAGMQQALNYAETLGVPFVFSSNGDAFLIHDRTGLSGKIEQELTLDAFPSPAELWQRYCQWKGLETLEARHTVEMPYYDDGTGRAPRYYQANAVNNTVEAVAKDQQRILLVMATGTGKTYTAFQIIWRLWKSGTKKRILFLADRNILVDQTKNNDFKPFAAAMTKISKRQIDKSYEIYLSLYQAVTNPPFGGMEEDGIETNFPASFRTRETADLFLVLIMQMLKAGGRAALVLPDGFLFGEGIKTRIKEKLLEECNLHTIVRLPNGVFAPYTGIKTNLLFFSKGTPTEHIWFYEHPYPPGVKSYNKTKPMRIEEFDAEAAWWGNETDGFNKRMENEYAWKVSIDDIKARNYNLDSKNPHIGEQEIHDPDLLLAQYTAMQADITALRGQLKDILAAALEGGV